MTTDLNKVKEYLGFLLAQEFAIEAPKDTSRLANSFIGTLEYTEKGFKFTLPEYAKGVIFGTAPHIIRPRNAQALAFKTKDGKTIITKMVRHPGNAPNFFIQDTLNRKFKDILKEAFRLANNE